MKGPKEILGATLATAPANSLADQNAHKTRSAYKRAIMVSYFRLKYSFVELGTERSTWCVKNKELT